MRVFENYISNNDPDCWCLIGVKVRANGNKDTNLSIRVISVCKHIFQARSMFVCRLKHWAPCCRTNETKTKSNRTFGKWGTGVLGEKPLYGFDGEQWTGCRETKNQTSQRQNDNLSVERSNLLLPEPVWKHIRPARPASWCLRVQERGTAYFPRCIVGLCTSRTGPLVRGERSKK